jgi:hypothetical protein
MMVTCLAASHRLSLAVGATPSLPPVETDDEAVDRCIPVGIECSVACKPCPSHPSRTFCPSDNDGAQCASDGSRWRRVGMGMCDHVSRPYGEELRAQVPFAFKGSWGPDAPNDARGYGWRYCGSASASFTNECQEFCDGIGDCIAISAGGCCFPYRARCGGRTDLSNSKSYVYYERQLPLHWGWGFLAVVAVILFGYWGGGLLAARWRGSGRHKWAHPHTAQWLAVWGLVIDGWQFAKGKGRYRKLGAAVTADARSMGRGGIDSVFREVRTSDSSTNGGKTKGKKKGGSKRAQAPKGHTRKGGSREGANDSETTECAPSSLGLSQPESVREWQPTRSAHLAAGARETGVKVQM